MARWSGDQEERIFGEGGRYEEQRRRGGGWQGGGREWDERGRGRERWMGGEDRGEEWRGGSRGEEWRDRDQERWTTGGEYGRGSVRGGEWDRERDDRLGGGGYGQGRGYEPSGRGYGEGLRGMGGEDETGPTFGAGGMYGGAGGRYGGSLGGVRRGGSGYGIGEYGGYGYGRERGGEWRGGWRDTSRDFGRDLRRHAGEEEGPFERMGERMKEGFRKLTGRGPKGYKRSDERIRDDVSEQIARSGVDADEVEVRVEKGEVTLTGFVYSREDKRMLEDIADDVFGVDEVNNHLRVQREQRQPLTAGQSQTAQGMTGQQAGQRTQQGTQPQPGRH